MRPLALDDLMPLADYASRRSEFFAAHGRYLDHYRRVRVGPRVTLVFENRQTLWYRVHELLRVARLADSTRVQQELDWYNRLLPGRDTFQAAVVIDMGDGPDLDEQLKHWQGLKGDCMRLVAADFTVRAQLLTCRPEDLCIGAAHWLTFQISGEMRSALGDSRRAAFIEIAHETYQHRSAPLTDRVRRSLMDDLELSDRDRAA
jgi:hypothetical protein